VPINFCCDTFHSVSKEDEGEVRFTWTMNRELVFLEAFLNCVLLVVVVLALFVGTYR